MRSTGNSPLFFSTFHAIRFFDFADAFEARGVNEVKQEATYKEVAKVREDKVR